MTLSDVRYEFVLTCRCPISGAPPLRCVVHRVSERQPIDVRRQLRIDDEAHRQLARLVSRERLRREAEALRLVKYCVACNGATLGTACAIDRLPAQVARLEFRLVQLAGCTCMLPTRAELPRADGRRVETNSTVTVAIASGASTARGALREPAAIAVAGHVADHVVQRHQREAEREDAGGEQPQLQRRACDACGCGGMIAQWRSVTTLSAMKPT